MAPEKDKNKELDKNDASKNATDNDASQSEYADSHSGRMGPIMDFIDEVKLFFKELFNMRGDIDRTGTVLSIRKNMRMRGANAWMLIFSILLASLGLDLNSPAVIIGAMLVSPLMSPILGVGLAVGMNDRETLSISLKNFVVSIVIALVVSSLYFILTPLGGVTDEIMARTKPTFLDGLVAISGGFAGIISSVQKDKSNAIPGVAIATALMPPLCVAGFGLTQDFHIFLSSFYLFFLNSFFIALSTYLTVRYMRFPQKRYMDDKEKRMTDRAITFFSIIIIIPSAFILFGVLKETQTSQKVNFFIKNEVEQGNVSVVGHILSEGDTSDILVMNVLGEPIESRRLQELDSIINSSTYAFKRQIKLKPIQAEVALDDFQKVQEKIRMVEGDLNKKLQESLVDRSRKEQTIQKLQQKMDSIAKSPNITNLALSKELLIAFDDLEKVAFGTIELPIDSFANAYQIAVLNWKNNTTSKTKQTIKPRLNEYLKLKLKQDTIILVDQ